VRKFIAVVAVMVMSVAAFAASAGPRKVMAVAATEYPALAKQMHVTGTVKVEAVVLPNGKVKEAKVIGGHPLLTDAALKSAKRWQFEPASEETVEVVAVNFKAAE
jgi:TonB family protein